MSALSQTLTFVVNTATTTIITYPQNGVGAYSYTSDKAKGDGYFGSSDGLHTVTYTVVENFIGNIKIQATLAADPTEDDWFDVTDTTITYPFPGENNTQYANFTGLFVWIRAVVSIEQGALHSVNYNH